MAEILDLPDVKAKRAEAGMSDPFMARSEIKDAVRREIATLKGLARDANVKPE